jgi:ADP-ribose pyrophosphatase
MPQESNYSCANHKFHNPENPHTVYEGFVTLTEETLCTAEGPYNYVTVHTRPLSVIILPRRSDGKWLVTKEWRYPVKQYVHSFPGGLVDSNELPLQAGRRELVEETGFDTEKLSLIGTCFPLPGLLQQTMSVVLAEDIQQVHIARNDGIEQISWDFYTMDELRDLLRSSNDLDAMGLAALALYMIQEKQPGNKRSMCLEPLSH